MRFVHFIFLFMFLKLFRYYQFKSNMGKDSVEEVASEFIERSAETNTKETEGGASVAGSNFLSKAGGAYIPPARLRMMQQHLADDKSSEAFQRANWERLKRKIHGQINRLNVSNIVDVARTLLRENLIRGRFVLNFLVFLSCLFLKIDHIITEVSLLVPLYKLKHFLLRSLMFLQLLLPLLILNFPTLENWFCVVL
jgi:hypothetical protein